MYELGKAINKLPQKDREIVLSLFRSEYTLRNITWAMRLRVYYGMEKEDILPRLAYASAKRDKDDVIASSAIKILSYPIDNYAQWADWEYRDLLNPNEEGVVWNLDPRWFEGEARKLDNRNAEKLFHRYPDSEAVLVCFFKMKLHELDCIRSVTEGLRMNIEPQQIKMV